MGRVLVLRIVDPVPSMSAKHMLVDREPHDPLGLGAAGVCRLARTDEATEQIDDQRRRHEQIVGGGAIRATFEAG